MIRDKRNVPVHKIHRSNISVAKLMNQSASNSILKAHQHESNHLQTGPIMNQTMEEEGRVWREVGGWEGGVMKEWRGGGGEAGRQGGKEAGREGGRQAGTQAGRQVGRREGGSKGAREGEWVRGREGGMMGWSVSE